MKDSQARFKVKSEYCPDYGGGYNVEIEDLNTGEVRKTWCYDKASISTTATRVSADMARSSNSDVEISYIDGDVESPAEEAVEAPEVEASE